MNIAVLDIHLKLYTCIILVYDILIPNIRLDMVIKYNLFTIVYLHNLVSDSYPGSYADKPFSLQTKNR